MIDCVERAACRSLLEKVCDFGMRCIHWVGVTLFTPSIIFFLLFAIVMMPFLRALQWFMDRYCLEKNR